MLKLMIVHRVSIHLSSCRFELLLHSEGPVSPLGIRSGLEVTNEEDSMCIIDCLCWLRCLWYLCEFALCTRWCYFHTANRFFDHTVSYFLLNTWMCCFFFQ
ncbi:hypothetical protein ACH5RR_039752 [Cinchona calisaya]|uniref:Uncharacterized protein n=1 Tax=Cinchona calisaya TaxID=153742 RepID=A0ABD2Y4F6_9GENT